AGQYDLDEPGQLVRLLVTMARNKLASAARGQQRQRRDQRRLAGDAALAQVAEGGPTPSRVAIGKELLGNVLTRLSDDERRIADLRGQGRAWDEVAQRLGGTAPARRMQLARAIERVARELGLDEDSHE